MSQRRRLPGDTQAIDLILLAVDVLHRLGHVVDVALGVDPPRNGQPHQLQRAGSSPVPRADRTSPADLHGADARLEVQRNRQRLGRELVRRDVRQHRARVDVDGVPARRLHDGHPCRGQLSPR